MMRKNAIIPHSFPQIRGTNALLQIMNRPNPYNTEKQEPLTTELQFDSDVESEDESVVVLADGQFPKKIITDKFDREVRSFCEDYEDGTLVLRPDFQRHFIWSDAKSSRLIESALLDVPLPTVYLFEEPGGKISVIDGQQRLTAFVSFVRGDFLDSDRAFALSGLKVLKGLNGKKFSGLEEGLRRKIRKTTIRSITFMKGSDPDLKFEVFERLNAESTSLKDQELRNCVYRGPYNDLLKRLSGNDEFRFLMGLQKGPEKRMRDVENVLRFAAFYHANYLGYMPPMKRFLNCDMERHQNISDKDAKALEEAFKQTTRSIRSLLGSKAFKRFVRGSDGAHGGHWEPQKFNSSLYDVLMWQFAQPDMDGTVVHRHLDSLREGLIALMTEDDDFHAAITLSTSAKKIVEARFDKFRAMVKSVVGNDRREPRCFSRALKQELYDSDPTCKLCGHHIADIDDAAVDHNKEYWAGGRTIPGNARLAHRYCNWARRD